MLDVLIIADDLTGAADCGIAFTVAGIRTFVATKFPATAPARVLALDTDTRALSASDAEAAVRKAAGIEARAVYKKIDSTLRGNIGAEVAAARGGALVVAAPAF